MPKQNQKWKNKLYFGDNLNILRDKIPDSFVDLIYLDPPFKSGKIYNIIFQPETGEIKGAGAQIQTFKDTWKWGQEAEKNYEGLIEGSITKKKPSQELIDLMKSMRGYLDECSMMAYLSMMAPRLLEMKRVLKNTGSIYLHCDPTASHYLKLLMDAVFGVDNFRNEIVWCYTGPSRKNKDFPNKHDIIFRYSKGKNPVFNPDSIKVPYSESFLSRRRYVEGKGGIYADKERDMELSQKEYKEGKVPEDWWSDIPSGGQISRKERVGYPTQKPEKLLERIIKASSNEKDLILDPFCGCGTSVAVAERLKRRWVGIDITYLAIDVISKRLKKNQIKEGIDFEVEGEPKDVYSAQKLVDKSPFQFEIWCISKLDAVPSQRKLGDKGVDGIINFFDPSKSSKVGKAIIQVKGTKNINPSMVRDLKGTLKSQNADFGILITFKKPTQGMIDEATKEGYFRYAQRKIPKIQFLIVEDLFKDPPPIKLPSSILLPYQRPEIEKETQTNLFDSQ